MLQRRLCFAGFALFCGSFNASVASANTISVFNTGQSGGGTALAVGATDSHYSFISAPPNVPLTAVATSPNGAWTGNTATADWISPGSSGNDSWPVGNYDYQTTFSLAGDNPASASLSGMWTSDNNGCIYLNGNNTGDCTTFAEFGTLISFSITSGFVAGTNDLDFIVTNGGGPSGVFAEVSGTASSTGVTPEPSSLLLALSGLSAAVLSTSRARRSKQTGSR